MGWQSYASDLESAHRMFPTHYFIVTYYMILKIITDGCSRHVTGPYSLNQGIWIAIRPCVHTLQPFLWQISALDLSSKKGLYPKTMWHPAIYLITTFISALLAIAFFTLLERKFLGYAQLRKGPNKVRVGGIPQPIADALKLFTKELNTPTAANYTSFLAAPIIALLLALIVWTLYPHLSSPLPLKWGILIFLALSRINVYTTLFSGWASNSKYSLLGALRRIAQTISYEVRIALIILTPIIIISSLRLNIISTNYSIIFIIIIWPLFIIWIITALAETNRTPFDLAEGESELVSGFNTEYRSGTFALIFIAEYINIIAIGIISWAIFISVSLRPIIDTIIVASLFTVRLMFIWARSAYPRMRYDKLIGLTWKQFLPLTLTTIMIITATSLWYCAGRTDNFDDVNYEETLQHLS